MQLPHSAARRSSLAACSAHLDACGVQRPDARPHVGKGLCCLPRSQHLFNGLRPAHPASTAEPICSAVTTAATAGRWWLLLAALPGCRCQGKGWQGRRLSKCGTWHARCVACRRQQALQVVGSKGAEGDERRAGGQLRCKAVPQHGSEPDLLQWRREEVRVVAARQWAVG